jgi:hypothetical protein
MAETEVWKIFAGLGVPGLALGVLYMLFRAFDWKLPEVHKAWVGPLLLVFMLIVGGIVVFALHLWSPTTNNPNSSPSSQPHDYGISEDRIVTIMEEYAVTKSALSRFFQELGKGNIPPESVPRELEEFAKQYKDMRDQIQSATATTPSQVAIKNRALSALEEGDLKEAQKQYKLLPLTGLRVIQ